MDMKMGKSLKFTTLNIRGLGGKKKYNAVFDRLKTRRPGIIFLQETHSTVELADKWKTLWQGGIYCAHGDSNRRGVAILFHSSIEHKVLDIYADTNGRFLILRVDIEGKAYTLVNCYLPTKDKEQEQCYTLTQIVDNLLDDTNNSLIVGGDFNINLNPDIDKFGGRSSQADSKQFRPVLNGMLETLALEDILRNAMPDKALYTWHNSTKGISSRLDYWFISDSLLNDISNCYIKTELFTDHDSVHFTLNSSDESHDRGPGYWKFNVSLLRNPEYVALVKSIISQELNTTGDYIDKGFFWDYVKMRIRTETITFSKQLKQKEQKLQNDLQRSLDILQSEHLIAPTTDKLEQINSIKKELENI